MNRPKTVIQDLVNRMYEEDHIEIDLMEDGEEKMRKIAEIGAVALSLKILLIEKEKHYQEEFARLAKIVKKQRADQPTSEVAKRLLA